ncbi:hypothetical protein PMA3_14360 [Pseudomonas silesiensis]|uniref:Uncharacterized protein n=2 Tax=Pseudomonas silesiensis TaxID=1853130 RepID=A0A191YU15_9PSED|nr:hypothetical protein PMA3_14360 [Pseudomonas silesiensis]
MTCQARAGTQRPRYRKVEYINDDLHLLIIERDLKLQFAGWILSIGKAGVVNLAPYSWLCILLTRTAGTAIAGEPAQTAQGFLEGSTLEVLSRNFYLNNDYRSPSPADKSY